LIFRYTGILRNCVGPIRLETGADIIYNTLVMGETSLAVGEVNKLVRFGCTKRSRGLGRASMYDKQP